MNTNTAAATPNARLYNELTAQAEAAQAKAYSLTALARRVDPYGEDENTRRAGEATYIGFAASSRALSAVYAARALES
jgi:hypothetical protein